MPDFHIRIRESIHAPHSRLLVLLSTSIMLAACATGQHTLDLMPAPALFAGGEVNPLPKGEPPVSYDDFAMLYATDRKPAEFKEEYPFYENQPGFVVRLGSARVKIANEGVTWDEMRQISLANPRPGDFPMRVMSVDETGMLPSTYTIITQPDPDSIAEDDVGQRFAALVNRRLAESGVKDVYIFVHGYRVTFDNPVLVSSELWHFLGYRGAFIAYAWPATPRALAYASDSESAVANGFRFRKFLTYLADETDVERIHVIAYSAGARLVVRALEQLALLNHEMSNEQIRKEIRVGHVIFVGGDVSREGFGAGIEEDMLRFTDGITVYVSSQDVALAWSRRIFRRDRLGQTWSGPMPPQVAGYLRANPSLAVIDVTDASGSTTGSGHAYFRDSPWVSSDILTLLAFGLEPSKRGLVRDSELPTWTFPPDYVERLKKQLLEMHPQFAGAKYQGGS